jgi:hypothetical protein
MPTPDVTNPRKLLRYNLAQLIEATWPEVTLIYPDTTVERVDWVLKLNKGELVAPWVVVVWKEASTDQWCANRSMLQVTPTVYYVADQTAADTAGVLLQDYIDTKLRALKAAVFADHNMGTVMNEVEIDTTADNPVNVSLIENKESLLGGSIMFTIIAPFEF